MSHKSILVLSDNETILKGFIDVLGKDAKLSENRSFTFACYAGNAGLSGKDIAGHKVEPIDVKAELRAIIKDFDLVISAHCKQIFPAGLVHAVRCINIHPGFNPYNRGWYPQVFSILNGLPLGATIHEIDEELDHGAIIAQERVELSASDTSKTAYDRVLALELTLLKRHLADILDGTYKAHLPQAEGEVNYRKDFDRLRRINLDEAVTFKDAIDRLRALTHPPYKNAYFIDPATGERIWVEISLRAEGGSDSE